MCYFAINKLSYLHVLGLLPLSECEKKECDTTLDEDKDTVGNNCYVNDGFNRTMLYRAWRPACNDLHLLLDNITEDYNAYILDHSDTLHYGSEVVIRCLPGFMLATSTHTYVRTPKFVLLPLRTLLVKLKI